MFGAAVFESCKVQCSAMTSHHFRVCVCACVRLGVDRFFMSVHFILSLKATNANAASYDVRERILKQCRLPWQLQIVEVF